MPVFQAFEIALRNHPEGISPSTICGYVADLEKFAVWFEKTNGDAMRLEEKCDLLVLKPLVKVTHGPLLRLVREPIM